MVPGGSAAMVPCWSAAVEYLLPLSLEFRLSQDSLIEQLLQLGDPLVRAARAAAVAEGAER